MKTYQVEKIIPENRVIILDSLPFFPEDVVEIVIRLREINENFAKKLESYTRLNNRQLNAIFKSSSDGIWVCDGHGNVISINDSSEKINGIEAKNIIGKNMADIVSEGWLDRSITLEVLETKQQVSRIQHIRITDKTILATGTPVLDEDGNIFMVVVNERDMTQLNALHEQLEQAREKLAELSVMELNEQKIIAQSEAMKQVLRRALKLSRLNVSGILISGESGTGKGLLAQFIHKNSSRRNKLIVEINCPAIPESLFEAELFGYEKGAFTNASERGKSGQFELADGGTLFLDEIGDMSIFLQSKLLKFLDNNQIVRIGSITPRKVDCAVIAATNRNIEMLIKQQKFRDDLFFRLNAFTIHIPPLRERPDDIFELVNYFLNKYNNTYKFKKKISAKAIKYLKSYEFPGNTRELESIIRRAVIMSDGNIIDEFIIFGSGYKQSDESSTKQIQSMRDEFFRLERIILETAIAKAETTRELAKHLGTSQSTVVRKLKKHGLSLS